MVTVPELIVFKKRKTAGCARQGNSATSRKMSAAEIFYIMNKKYSS